MTSKHRRARRSFARLAAGLGDQYGLLAQAEGFRVTDIPGDVEFTDADWDGDDAEASYPNPSDDDTDLDFLADHYLFVPDSLDADDPPSKSDFKAPIRMGPGGPVNTNALTTILNIINGGMGGFDGLDEDTLEAGYDEVVDALVSAGVYDGAGDAPDFDPDVSASASADFDIDGLAAEATGTVTVEVSPEDALEAAHDDSDGVSLGGIIWGAGDHDLSLGGEPTPVRVPQESIPPTFEALTEDVASGDVTLGFDHPGRDSVAVKTGIVDIGTAEDVALTADEQHIVLTDSELSNDQAAKAAEAGDFDDLDWSVVADVAVRRDQNGDIVTEDGRVVIDATRIRRIDAVDTGAVDAASIERDADALPDLKDEARTVQQAASQPNQRPDAVQALQASANAITETMGNSKNFDPDFDDDLPDDVQNQLNAAADIIDDQQKELEAAQAKASGFESLLSAHDVDQDDFEDPQAAAQAVIDEQTEQTREEIAELEADLAQYDVDDVEARAEDLAGNDPQDLQNTLNARKAEAFDRQQKAQQKGRAAAKGDSAGRVQPIGGDGSGGDADADDLALSAMDGGDRIEAEARGQSPSEYVQDEYGLNASQYDAPDDLHSDILDAMSGDA